MKYFIVFCQCSFITAFSYSQSASDFYKKADSLVKVKEFQKAGSACATAIRNDLDVGTSKYWNCACAWSLAGNADSAFHFLNFLTTSDKVNTINTRGLEEDEDFIPIRTDSRWHPTLYAVFQNAITNLKIFSDIVRNGKRINPSVDKYNIALAWAAAKNADSTIFYLNMIINTDHNRFTDYTGLTNQKAFSFLQKDQKWISLLEEVKMHSPPFTCEHTPREWRKSMTFVIDDKSKFLRSDGRGIYKNGENKIASYFMTAYNFLTSGIQLLEESGNWSDSSSRYFSLDLNSPVIGSGAIKQGIIGDHFTAFHSFYKIDTSLKLDLIYNLNQMPVGITIESPRTDFEFFINGRLHQFHFGYWGLGDCGEWYARGSRMTGAGTTSIRITRNSENSYTIEAPPKSIGRLWDINNLTQPIDKGLFESAFIIHVAYQ